MAGPNTSAIYSRVGDIQWTVAITAANTAMDGTGTVSTVFTSDATNGGLVQRLRLKAAGSNVATVARVFVNNGASNTNSSNNALIDEISLPATTLTQTAGMGLFEVPLGFALPPGFKLNVVLGTAVAAGWIPTVIGGKY